MRTTVRLDDALLTEAKQYAAVTGMTLTALIEESLRERLRRREEPRVRKKVRLTTYKGRGGLRPGVDLDNSAALLDIMEGLDDPR